MFIAAKFLIARVWNQSTVTRERKYDILYMMEWYSTLEENEIMTFASSCIELAILVPGAVSPAQDDKSAFSYLWKLIEF